MGRGKIRRIWVGKVRRIGEEDGGLFVCEWKIICCTAKWMVNNSVSAKSNATSSKESVD